jgi:P-type Ca2+ transporter type 2C
MKPYQQSAEEVIKDLKTNPHTGLSNEEAKKRLQEYGPNSFPEAQPDSWFVIILNQFKSPLIYVLFAAALITIFLGEWFDAIIIFGVMFFNTIIGSVQEGKTQKIISSLRKMLKTESIVLRNNQKEVIPDSNIVPGDIVVLQEGARVPADIRLINANDLTIDEAVLTGESRPIDKNGTPLTKKTRIYEQSNMAFQGTYIINGNGKGVVIATGTHTEIGQLHKIIETISSTFPLKVEMERLAQWIIIITLSLMIILFITGYLLKIEFIPLLIMLTALFVSVIPEGLPVIGTLVLVRGAYEMAKKQFLVKRLQAVEALGRTNIILTDKTGTITRNEMMVTHAYVHNKWFTITGEGYKPKGQILENGKEISAEEKKLLQKLACSTLMSNTQLYFDEKQKIYRVQGNQTEAAMIVFAQKLGICKEDMQKKFKLLYEQPFDKKRRYNFGCFSYNGSMICYMTGSPETIMKHAKNGNKPDHIALEKMLALGLRVIGIATLETSLDHTPHNYDDFHLFIKKHFNDIKFEGLFGLQDAIRSDVKESINQAHALGVQVALVTGDHPKTAELIAREVDIYKKGDHITTGQKFLALSEKERKKITSKTTVYARFVPKEKFELVQTYHQLGDIVAMTGDGVNDAPSLAAADIGIAMGTMGTEVAKQAADAILLNDSFCSIVEGIYEGRNVFYTLRRIIMYFFATNLSEVLVVMLALFLGLPQPLLASQILWMNIVTDGFLDIGLVFEPKDKKMLKSSSILHKKIIDKHLFVKIFFMMIPMIIGSLWVFNNALPGGLAYAHTMILTTMVIFQWFNALNCRSEQISLFKLNPFKNKILIIMMSVAILLQLIVIYTPLRHAFRLVPLSLYDWFLCTMIGSTILLVNELRKLLFKKI